MTSTRATLAAPQLRTKASGGGFYYQRLGSGISPDNDSTSVGASNGATASSSAAPPFRRYVGATLYVFLITGVFFYWTAFPLSNTVFVNDYPQFGTPPSPGPFRGNRYDWEWWFIWLLTLNALMPILLMLALVNNDVDEFARVHHYFGIWLVGVNMAAVALLTINWVFMCNTNSHGGYTACQDYRWCCAKFPSPWCPNTTPCTPNVASSELHRNPEHFQHWVFAMVFLLLTFWNLSINRDFRRYGMLK